MFTVCKCCGLHESAYHRHLCHSSLRPGEGRIRLLTVTETHWHALTAPYTKDKTASIHRLISKLCVKAGGKLVVKSANETCYSEQGVI